MDRKADEVASAPSLSINEHTRVGELLTRWPGSIEILVRAGLTPLADANRRELVKDLPVTLEMACVNHGLDVAEVVRLLRAGASPSR